MAHVLENPGNGGWAAIININGNLKRIKGSEKNTTNNRMELMAPIKLLKNIPSLKKKLKFIQILSM